MERREPPHLATWILRHLTAGYRDEALDGDLFEVFRLGRSNAWYWREVFATCVHSWCNYLYARGPVLLFALLWSTLSPAWYATIDSIEASTAVNRASQMFQSVWLPLALIGWMLLHTVFFWAGLLVYRSVHCILQKPLRLLTVQRSFWIAALIFPLISGVTFLIGDLYWYSIPSLCQAKLAPSFVGQVSDLGFLADFIRFPYFAAMLIALWGTVQEARHDGVDELFIDSTTNPI